MCSILGIFEIEGETDGLRRRALDMSRRQRHRGPDWSGVYAGVRAILAHERLAIVDIDSGAQPLRGSRPGTVLAVNGEIYNHASLADALDPAYPFRTRSDCEVILALYERRPDDLGSWLNEMNGIFAFALFDEERDRYVLARDPIGVMPMYTGRDPEGRLYVASEMKALIGVCPEIRDFPPGHYLDSEIGRPVRYYEPAWRRFEAVEDGPSDPHAIRVALEAAVERQLMSDVPYATLLSGGLDSSIIAALAMKHSRRRVESGGREEAWWPRLHSFAIGLDGSPDLAAARSAAESIGTVHHEVIYTIDEGLDALSDVIRHLETFDVTTVRASTPMYLMARRIKAMGIKMVLSGEGADEVFGGYLYFHKAPGARAFHEETVRKLDQLYKYDCLRANKSMAAWGIEARVPFLDQEFLDVAMSLDPEAKRPYGGRVEKDILRRAFDGLLPTEILWRQKEQFSDGVGYGWIDSLRDLAEREVSDQQLSRADSRFPTNPPVTKEAYLYRTMFQEHFPGEPAVRCVPEGPSIACSTPAAIAWDPDFAANADPSGRAVAGVHERAYGEAASRS